MRLFWLAYPVSNALLVFVNSHERVALPLVPAEEFGAIGAVFSRLVTMEHDFHRQRLVEIKKLKELLCGGRGGQSGPPSAYAPFRPPQVISPGKALVTITQSFAGPFSFDELCTRLDVGFPGLFPDRAALSRRFFQLRSRKTANIEVVPDDDSDADVMPARRSRQRLYRYVGASGAAFLSSKGGNR